MSAVSMPVDATSPPSPEASGLRVRTPVIGVIAYWATYATLGVVDIGNFEKFLGRLAALGVLLIVFLGWWLFQRRTPLRERFAVLAVAAIAAALALMLRHPSIEGPLAFNVVIHGIQATLTIWAMWLLVARSASASGRRRGMMAAAVLAWAWVLAVRMDGFAGDGQAVFHWRWTPSGEEQFLAEQVALKGRATKEQPLAALPLTLTAEDWPEFRGPDRDGAMHGVEIATNWSEAPPKLAWKRRIGPGWSSLVVVGDRLFTQEQRGEQEAVVCFDAATGDEVWRHEDRGRFQEAMGGDGPRATPTFADGRLFALGANGLLNCLDAATGTRHWTRDVTEDGQHSKPTWGFCSSPLIVDGKVVVFAGGGESNRDERQNNKDAEGAEDSKQAESAPVDQDALLAYDVDTGELVWRAAAGRHSYSSPQLAEFDGQQQVLFVSDVGLTSVDPATGKRLWRLPAKSREAVPSIQPHVLGDSEFLVSISSRDGVVRGKVERDGDQWRVDVVWPSRDIKPFFNDFVRAGDALFGFDGSRFCCIDADTGKRRWKQGRYGSGQVLLVADQPVLLVISESGEAVLVAANAERHEELGRFQAIEGKTWNHPTIVRGRLYVRNAQEMACFEL